MNKPRVAIIGGGPGGAQCARRLAEVGVPVTLFEPRSHFEKACGGGIPARGIERFPFLIEPSLPGKEIRHCLMVAPSGREVRLSLSEPITMFGRGDLHTFLLSRAAAAGARLERARVVAFQNDDPSGTWTLSASPAAGGPAMSFGPFDFLVAADGAAGAARRRLLPTRTEEETSQGIGYYLSGVSEDFLTLKFYDRLHGYLWVFPRPDHSSAGICATLGAQPVADLRKLMDDFLQERYPIATLREAEGYAALIPSAPRDPSRGEVQGEGWALVGDAGRAVDPLTREGIYYAMLSGDHLAEALIERRPERYAQTWNAGAARELSWAARHAERFYDRRFLERLLFLCAASPSVARLMSDVMVGRQSYRTLKLRLGLLSPAVGAQVLGRLVSGGLRPARDN